MKNDENVLQLYLKEINAIPLLTREEETELAIKAAAGDKKAKDAIIKANLRFVVNVAKRYQNHGLDLIDLISEGNIGLLIAIDHFDVHQGYHFISYAVWWIRQTILKAICEKSRAIRLPVNKVNEVMQIERARKMVTGNKTEEEEIEEVGRMLDMKPSHVKEMINLSREMISLDSSASVSDDIPGFVGDYVEDTGCPDPYEQALHITMKEDIQAVLRTLRPKEAQVLRLRYGLNGERPLSLKEIGDRCNLTKERIRQIEKRALGRMRHPYRMSKLQEYVA